MNIAEKLMRAIMIISASAAAIMLIALLAHL